MTGGPQRAPPGEGFRAPPLGAQVARCLGRSDTKTELPLLPIGKRIAKAVAYLGVVTVELGKASGALLVHSSWSPSPAIGLLMIVHCTGLAQARCNKCYVYRLFTPQSDIASCHQWSYWSLPLPPPSHTAADLPLPRLEHTFYRPVPPFFLFPTSPSSLPPHHS